MGGRYGGNIRDKRNNDPWRPPRETEGAEVVARVSHTNK